MIAMTWFVNSTYCEIQSRERGYVFFIFILSLQSIPEVLELVVKTPVTDEYLVSIYLPAVSCVKENAFYSQFIPAMKQLQIEANVPETKQINGFIEYIGSRHSLVAGTLCVISQTPWKN